MPEETRRHRPVAPPGPLALDVRELSRRPGALLRISRTVPAPADLGLDVIGVPAGADLQLDVRLESVLEGVVVSGTAQVPLAGECVRCLDPISDELVTEFAELFVYPGSDGDDETLWIEDDTVDLDPVLRDAVVLSLPLQPVCEPDCPGLCPQCGARLADEPDHRHEAVDSRWAALERLAAQERGGHDHAGDDAVAGDE